MLKKIFLFAIVTILFGSGLIQIAVGSIHPSTKNSYTVYAAEQEVCQDGNPPKTYEIDGKNVTSCFEKLTREQRQKFGQDVCQTEGLSWLICPIIDLLTSAIEKTEQFILGLLFNKNLTTGAQNDPDNIIYSLWSNIRNVANALLALVFLIMILGNAISIGIDAYTIKRTLPRLVIAAILMQFSFALCGLFIEFTNLIGVGVLELGNTVTRDVSFGGAGGGGQAIASLGLAAAAALVLASLASGGGVLVLIAALISAIGTFITLGLRQLLILILVLTSPLAILAWILPNTEGLFKTWFKNFTRTLLMFPLIAALMVVARIGSRLAFSQGNAIQDLLGFILIIAPLFAVPFTFKWAGGIMSAGAGAITGFAAGRASQLKGSQFAKNLREGRREANLSNAVAPGVGFGAKTRRGIGKLGAYGGGAVVGGGVTKAGRMRYQQRVAREGAAAQGAIAGRYQEALKARGNRLEAYDFSGGADARKRNVQTFGEKMVSQIESSGVSNANDLYGMELQKVASGGSSSILGANGSDIQMQTSAISEMAKRGDVVELRSLQTAGGGNVNQSTIMAGIGDSAGDIMGKAPDIIKRGAPGHAIWGKMTGEKITGLDETSVELMRTYMADTNQSSPNDINAKSQIRNEAIRIANNPDLQKNLTPATKTALNGILAGTGLNIQ